MDEYKEVRGRPCLEHKVEQLPRMPEKRREGTILAHQLKKSPGISLATIR